MSLIPGREISHYRLIEQIGEGGMGVVWRATDTSLGRDVAIKVLPAAFAGDPERMARFEREARVLASLNHPHIASIFGVGSADGVRFLAMELVEGEDLAVRIARGPIPVEEAVELARQLAEALEAAHEKGVIHRDLKPANLKLTADGQIKVLDFGLAKALDGDATQSIDVSMTHSPTITSPMTAPNVILGTAAYMSPEQARGRAVDRRADIWAFGCVLFESLTGARPFAGETVSDTLARILERDPDFGILPAATPARVRELLQRCLEKDARRRLRDIGDARLTLEDVLATRSPSGRLVLYDAGPRTGASPAGSKWVPVIAAAVGLALGAALWHWFGLAAAGGAEETSCVSVGMPPDVSVQQVWLTNDGQTVVVLAQPSSPPGAAPAPPRIYTRRLDRFEFKELPGTEGTLGFSVATDDRSLLVLAPTSSVSSQIRLAKIPLDGSAPATTLTEFEHTWSGAPLRMDNGDLLFLDRGDSFVRVPAAGGNPSPPMRMDAGRSGVSNYALSWPLPGDRAILVDVVAYDARGWHYSVGVMDVHTGKVKVIEEDGGSARYSPTGHLVFARGDAILAAPFDLGRLEPVGAPIAVWSGLSARFIFTPGIFNLARNGSLFYRPGQAGGERSFATLDASGKLVPWSAERRAVDAPPEISPDGRRLACTIPNSRGIDEIWTSPIDSPGFQRLGTDPGADASAPVWSPDSKRIAYLRVGKNSRDGIYVQDAEGGEARLIFKVDDWLPRSWLTDGSMLIVKRGPSGSSLKLLKIDGEPTDSTRLRPLLTSEFNLFEARVSPDGRHIAVLSDESGPISAYMAELRPDGSTSRPVQLKSETATEIRWASDGSALYLRDDHNRILRCPVSLAAPTEVCDLDKLGIAMWSVLRDGRLLMGLKNDNETQITHYNLVLNWTKELERKLKAAR